VSREEAGLEEGQEEREGGGEKESVRERQADGRRKGMRGRREETKEERAREREREHALARYDDLIQNTRGSRDGRGRTQKRVGV
jgi:hypothetical protein